MDDPLPLSEAAIRELASAQVYARGLDYYRRGAVEQLTRRGDQLHAAVQGSDYAPYQVTVTLGAGGIREIECTCPYEWGGACKHVVATLLAYLEGSAEVEERPALDSLLAPLDRAQLQTLVQQLVAADPALIETVEAHVRAQRVRAAGPSAAATLPPVNPAHYRRQLRAALADLPYWRDPAYYARLAQLGAVLQRAKEEALAYVDAGDAASALTILETLTDEYVAQRHTFADSDALYDLADQLDALWVRVLVYADLPHDARETWAERLAEWAGDLEDVGVEEAFFAAEQAALQGWEDPHLQRILAGAGTPTDARALASPRDADDEDEEGDVWDGADRLTVARLEALERQGRTEQYLRLAAATGQHVRLATMLIRLGRIGEAVEQATTHVRSPQAALDIAQALHAAGATAEALRVAAHGLGQSGQPTELARWTRDVARAAGDTKLALRAVRVGWRASPSLADFHTAQALAGPQWPKLRAELLRELPRAVATAPWEHASAAVDVYLAEGLLDEAITIADRQPPHSPVTARVADAAIERAPDWVIRAARREVAQIVNAGNSARYEDAARWLERARDAWLETGREAEWLAYLDELLAAHQRKYKLVPLLKRLR